MDYIILNKLHSALSNHDKCYMNEQLEKEKTVLNC